MTRSVNVFRAALTLCGFVLLPACGERTGSDEARLPDESDCLALTALSLTDTEITAASVVPAGIFQLPGTTTDVDVPQFCRVVGTASPAVNFEVWLPMTEWNGKFQGVGNGGMAGTISYAAMARGLQRGYATASTDTGHEASGIPFDASWAMGRPDLVEDFGHRALHVTTERAKEVVTALFEQPPQYSYYVGCSKGGQQGMMEAQRYPEDYDGLLIGNPAHEWTRFYAGAHLWYSLATLDDPESYIPRAKLEALGAAVDAACDMDDGVGDGVIQYPQRCEFDPAALTCPAGVDNESCLTGKQVEAARKIWAGARDSSGELIFPGLVPGGEGAPGGWDSWVTGAAPFQSLHWLGGEGFFRYFVFEDPDWDFRTFDYDADLDYALEKVGPALDANDPDLRPLRDGGGKLLLYHGASDADISPLSSIEYFERVVATTATTQSRAEALAETQDFFRLFLVPGMGHCSGGPGANQFDGLAALEAWVENGVTPERIIASRGGANGVPEWTRPLCAYPEVARWDEEGDPNQGESWACVLPDS